MGKSSEIYEDPENLSRWEGGQKWSKSGQNSVPGPSEIAKTLSLIGKTRMEKTNAQNLIKPVENEDFLSQNRKMASKMIKKHYVYR